VFLLLIHNNIKQKQTKTPQFALFLDMEDMQAVCAMRFKNV